MYGNESQSCTKIFYWFKKFKEKREMIGDNLHRGHHQIPKTDADIQKVGEIV